MARKYRQYSEEMREQMVQLYKSGMSVPAIARQFGMHPRGSTIYRILHRAEIEPEVLLATGGRLGELGGYRRFDDKTEVAIATAYLEGHSIKTLAAEWSCDVGTIKRILARRQVERHRAGNRAKVFTASETQSIIDIYRSGASMDVLAKKMHLSPATIRTLLLSNGVSLHRVAKVSGLSETQLQDIYARWHAGESQAAIGQSMDLSQGAISRVLHLRLMAFDPARRPRGPAHGSWKGGRIQTSAGYVMVRLMPDDPYFCMANGGGYVMEHRLLMAKALGRPLTKSETVHHIDGHVSHNNLSNLQLRSGQHGHHIVYRCLDCGSSRIGPVPLANGAAPEQMRLLEG